MHQVEMIKTSMKNYLWKLIFEADIIS